MKEKSIYKRDYRKEDEYYKLKKEITDNFLIDERLMPSGNCEQRYIGLEDNVFIRISFDFERWSMNSPYKSAITIEKIGPNAEKTSEIETLLLKEGFKVEHEKKK